MSRFMRKGKSRFYWVPTIVSALYVPTAAEVTAGSRLDASISDISGFTFGNNPINVPDMSKAFVGQINGEDASEDSSLTFYEDDTTNTIRTLLAKGTNGFVVIFKSGTAGANPAAADKADVWPVIVASNAPQYTADNEAAKFLVKFSNKDAPASDVALT